MKKGRWKIRKSTIAKAGDGLFVTRNVKVNTVVAYFNGMRVAPVRATTFNPFKKRSVYLVEGSDDNGAEFLLDIPDEYIDVKKFNATSAHKVSPLLFS